MWRRITAWWEERKRKRAEWSEAKRKLKLIAEEYRCHIIYDERFSWRCSTFQYTIGPPILRRVTVG